MIDRTKIQSALKSPRTRKYGLRVFLAFVAVGVLGFFVLPPIVKFVLLDKLSETLHRTVVVERISINPYTLSMSLEGLQIKERGSDEPFVGFDSLYVNLQSTSLFRWGAVVNEIRLVNPRFRIVRLADNRYNFSDLIDEFAAKPKTEGPPPAFSLNNIQISGGTLEFEDRLVDEKHVVSDITLALPFVSSMAYAADIFVEPHFSATVNGAPLQLKGKSKPFASTRDSEFVLELDNVQLPKYFDYSPVKLPVRMESGALDTDLSVVFRQEDGKRPKLLLSGTAVVKDLNIVEAAGQPLASVKQLDVVVGGSDLLGGDVAIERVAVDSPEIAARVSREGVVNWLALLPKSPAPDKVAKVAEAAAAPASALQWSLGEVRVTGGALRWKDESNSRPFGASVEAIDAVVKNLDSKGTVADFQASLKVDGGELLKVDSFAVKDGKLDLARKQIHVGDASVKGVRGLIRRSSDGRIEWIEPPALQRGQPEPESTPQHASEPWKITVARYVGEAIGMRFEDAAVSPKAVQNVEELGFELADLSTDPGQAMQVKARFKLNRQGDVALEGKVVPAPLDASLDLDIKTVELLPLQPYFAEKLNIDVTRGLATIKGKADVRLAGAKPGEPGLSGGFSGQATIGDFQAVDKLNSADFLRWKSFYAGAMDVRFGPEAVSIGEVALSDFFARVIVSPEGKLNLLQIVRQDENAPTPPPAAAPAVESSKGKASVPVEPATKPVLPVKVGKITLQGGSVRFTDNFVKPNYTANLRQIGGSITGLSSESGTQAQLELRGSYDNVAPLQISARINPLSAKPYLDLQADVKGVELTSLSTYSAKYAGYNIEKGKLSVFVKYKIENDVLEAENRVFLDQLTFGDAVDSPDATKLPVRLAVALLKNRAGEIDVNLPISGSLNDPQFSVGGLVVRVIVNLLAKAVTSPFALIGSMFGGSGEELSSVDFDFGRAALTPDAVKRLEGLAKALIDRPELKLEIEPKVDAEHDPEGLKRARIDRKVRALKREDMTRRNVASGSAETVEVSAEEYPALLERVYRDEKFPKPRNVIGLTKSLPVEEMEKLMLANSAVDEDDLRGLGDRRARAVRDWLVEHQVPAERVFILPGKILAGGSGTNGEGKSKGSRADFSLK